MAVNWEKRREHIREWYALVERCRETIRRAQADLGVLSVPQRVDLLLDNHPELKDSGEARKALTYINGRVWR